MPRDTIKKGFRILFLVPYPLKKSPSQRFRFEQYLSLLRSKGYVYEVDSFLQSQNWQKLSKLGGDISTLWMLAAGFVNRLRSLFRVRKFDFIFIHREALPVGPPLIEWLIARVLKRKIIYDFDDAIWLTDKTDESALLRWMKWRSKVSSISKWSYKVSCGNSYLSDFARRFNECVVLNPTTIDLLYHSKVHQPESKAKVVIGWTGSFSTVKYLQLLERVLQRIEDEFTNVEVMVIADRAPNLNLKRLVFVPWRAETEMDDLNRIDIGVMPLPDDEWSKGKCGFKILQYMALAIPAVASAVGANDTIIQQGESGYLCNNDEEWFQALCHLILDPDKRLQTGKLGQRVVRERYSVQSNSSNFLSLFA